MNKYTQLLKQLSFLRKHEPSCILILDSRFHGNDNRSDAIHYLHIQFQVSSFKPHLLNPIIISGSHNAMSGNIMMTPIPINCNMI